MSGVRAVAAGVALALLLVGGTAAAQGVRAFAGRWQTGYGSADPLVVLAIGSDQGPPQRPGDPLAGLADGIHLFVVDTAGRRMTVVDIPRDAAIGGTKVNAHLVRGGPEELERQLEAWSGLPIDFWVLGSFRSVEAVVAELGGVAVDVERPMVDPFSGTDLQPGRQVLDPGQALAFTRNRRSMPDGDIGRTRNQTRLMLAALQQVQQADLPDLVRVLRTVQRHTETDIPVGELLPIALTATSIPPTSIQHVTLSGPFGFIGPASVVLVQPGDVFARLNRGEIGPPPP